MNKIGTEIKELRKREGLKPSELIKKVNLGGSNARGDLVILERLENGSSEPNENQIWNLARYFDSPDLLDMYFSDKKSSNEIDVDVDESKFERDVDYFVDKVNGLIKKTGKAKSKIAEEADIAQTTMQKYTTHKSYKNFPQEDNMKKLCDYFDVDPEYFYKPRKEIQTEKEAPKKKVNKVSSDELTIYEDHYEIDGEIYYSTRQLWERWNMTFTNVSPYVSELKSDGEIKAKKYKRSNLVHESDIRKVYDSVPDKHKTEYSDHQVDIMVGAKESDNLEEKELRALLNKADILIKKVDELKDHVKELEKDKGFFPKLFDKLF